MAGSAPGGWRRASDSRASTTGSGAHEPGDGLGCLVDLGGGGVAALGDGAGDAVAEVFFQQPKCHRLQGLGGGGYLGEDVDAVLVVLDHALEAADLPFDPAQPDEVVVLVLGVSVHVALRPWCGAIRAGVFTVATVSPTSRTGPERSWLGWLARQL